MRNPRGILWDLGAGGGLCEGTSWAWDQPGHPEGRTLGGTISVAAGAGGVEGRGASTQSEKPKLEGTWSHEASGKLLWVEFIPLSALAAS